MKELDIHLGICDVCRRVTWVRQCFGLMLCGKHADSVARHNTKVMMTVKTHQHIH
jgi:hypothetical protein